jgi:hypothetical protein
MGIANENRATSTLSATPNMSYTPEITNSAARTRFENKMSTEARKKIKDDIERYLKNDQQSI